MMYEAIVRLQKGQNANMLPFNARDVREAAEVVRAKYGLDTDNPHHGFVITEVP